MVACLTKNLSTRRYYLDRLEENSNSYLLVQCMATGLTKNVSTRRYYLDRLEENSNSYLAFNTIAVDSQVLSLLDSAVQSSKL
jgi:hypothetical protein